MSIASKDVNKKFSLLNYTLFCDICTWPLALGAWSEALGGQAVEAGQLGLGDHGPQHRCFVPEDDRALDIWSRH